MIQLTGAGKRYGPRILFENADWLVTPNERTGIVGANGSGKSSILKVLAGIEAHSLALLSDAGHNFTDALALLLAWFGYFLQAKPADEIKTYGYQRAGVLSAFVNALTLLALSAWIFYESALRLRQPPAVHQRGYDQQQLRGDHQDQQPKRQGRRGLGPPIRAGV